MKACEWIGAAMGLVSIPLPGFIVMKDSDILSPIHKRTVSIPLPGFIVMKVVDAKTSIYLPSLVSIPLPGFIVMKASFSRVRLINSRECFNPVAGIHCNESQRTR